MRPERRPALTHGDNTPLLNELQRLHFEVFLAMLENTLDKIERRSRVRSIRALLTAEVVRFDDCYASKLCGYGRTARSRAE